MEIGRREGGGVFACSGMVFRDAGGRIPLNWGKVPRLEAGMAGLGLGDLSPSGKRRHVAAVQRTACGIRE
jgi:hypothetical protein